MFKRDEEGISDRTENYTLILVKAVGKYLSFIRKIASKIVYIIFCSVFA